MHIEREDAVRVQTNMIFTVLFFFFHQLFIFAKLKQSLFHGWSLWLVEAQTQSLPCDEVFGYAWFVHHIGPSPTGSDQRGAGHKANIYCV